MKKQMISLILCLMMLASMLPAASADMLEDLNIADPGSLPAALEANDKKAVLKALEGDLSGSAVVVDLKTFNAIVITPAENALDMYGAMSDVENRVVIGLYENEHADAKTAISKDTQSFYFYPQKGQYKSDYVSAITADLRNLTLPERAEQEFDALLDQALRVRERGFYDIKGEVCSGCGTYTHEPEDHSVLPCGVHMSCTNDKNDIAHYVRCRECGRMACACYCNNYLSAPICIAVTGNGEYAVAGNFHELIALSFDKDADVKYIGLEEAPKATPAPAASAKPEDASAAENAAAEANTQEATAEDAAQPAYRPTAEVTPEVKCVVCQKSITVPQGIALNCGSHYTCPECRGKLTGAEESSHEDVLECGHYSCDGKKHSTEIFSESCPYEPKHHKCEGETGMHECSACGKQYPCEDAAQHASCYVCGRPICVGEHIDCDYCGGRWCDGRYHGPSSCV